ncbi:hypothetical protein BGM26_16455 [Bacillus sp. FJAT-29790]|uniref:hypothetical protein n=1 Tax=Bacillus sp. FJAT-29790 TaxID=1895002 RepID=UPI001C22AE54|nr:hypothetical protein [Bacillus sp. FJAT-29790]MBU8880548.1 hypothetical protein [Bacillus sp. FJAT-29790]
MGEWPATFSSWPFIYKSICKDRILDKFQLCDFTIQLGDVKGMHGFDGIIGSDFFLANKLIIDFENMEVRNIKVKVNTATSLKSAITI